MTDDFDIGEPLPPEEAVARMRLRLETWQRMYPDMVDVDLDDDYPFSRCEDCGNIEEANHHLLCPAYAERIRISQSKAEACRQTNRICGGRNGIKPFEKRAAARARRRAEKRDPENAPTRLREVIRGWAD